MAPFSPINVRQCPGAWNKQRQLGQAVQASRAVDQFYDNDLVSMTRYWSHGCWCFQMGDHPLRMGNGQPVDDIDRFDIKILKIFKIVVEKNWET